MSEIDWAAIRTEYEAGGISLRQLAAKHTVSKTYLIERRDKEGWNRPDRPPLHRPPTAKQAANGDNSTPQKNTLSTKEKQRLFLEAYAEQANVMVAAKAAGIHRTTVYTWLEKDEDFSFAYNQAKEDAKDVLRAEIFRRAKAGWEEDVYSFGKFQGTVRKYSDTLLIFHSKALMSEYRDKQQVELTGRDGGPIDARTTLALDLSKLRDATPEQLAALKALALELKAKEEGER